MAGSRTPPARLRGLCTRTCSPSSRHRRWTFCLSVNGAPVARTPEQNRTVDRSIHRPGAELPITVRQLGPATPVSLDQPDLEGQTAGAGVGFAVVVTPVDLQDPQDRLSMSQAHATVSASRSCPPRRPGAWAAARAAVPGTACRPGSPLVNGWDYSCFEPACTTGRPESFREPQSSDEDRRRAGALGS